MQVNVEVLNGLNRKIVVTVPAEGIDQEIEKRIKELTPRAKIAGFREGKVPIAMVRQRFGDSVRNEVLTEILQDTYRQALQQEKLVPVGMPNMNLIDSESGKPLQYEATFEIYPSIELKDVSSFSLDSYTVEIAEQDVDEMLERLKKQLIQWDPVERPAQMGDQVLIDFEGRMDNQPFPEGTGKQALLELGSNSAIPGFEAGLVGAKAGENVVLNLTFPENYARQEFASKAVEIKVTLHKISEPKLPELNEEFAEKFGIKEGGLPALRLQVRKNMEVDIHRVIKNHLRSQLVDKLLQGNPIELPQSLVMAEVEKLKQQARQQLTQMGKTFDEEKSQERFVQIANQRVGLGLLLGEYIRKYAIKVDSARVQAMLEQAAASYQDPASVIAYYRSNKDQMAGIENMVLEEQVVEELLKQVKVKEQPVSYMDFISSNIAATSPEESEV